MKTPKLFGNARIRNRVAALLVAATALVATPALAQSSGEMKPLAVVGINSYDEITADIDFVGGLVGNPQLGQMVKQMGAGFTQGMDTSKPIGLIVQTDGAQFNGAICAPIADLEGFTQMLALFGMQASKEGEGLWKINANGQDIYAKQAGEWALMSIMPAFLDGLPEDPAAVIASVTDKYDFGVQCDIQNIPEMYKQQAIMLMKQAIEINLQPTPGESDEQFEARKEATMVQMEQMEEGINGLDELLIGLSIDSEGQRALLDFAYTAVEGSDLAAEIAINANPKTNFAGFLQPDAAMMMSLSSKVAEADAAQLDQVFATMRKQLRTAVEEEGDLPTEEARETLLSAIDDFIDAFRSTIESGGMDGGMVVNLAPDSLSIVAGGFVGDPAKIESGLKKIADLAKEEPEFPGVNWDAESHAGFSFHTLSAPIPGDKPEPRQLFGETLDVAIGIGEQAVYFSAGRDCMANVKKVIDASAAAPEKATKPMEMSISLGPILEVAATMAEGEEAAMIEKVSAVLNGEADGRDHIRVTSEMVDRGARVRIELEDGVLKAIGVAGMEAQAKKMQQQGF